MEIKVTQRHINDAHTQLGVMGVGKQFLCPIERALLDLGYHAKVSTCGVYFPDDPIGSDVALPVAAENFVYEFDDGMPVEPFSFDLDIPASVLKIAREE